MKLLRWKIVLPVVQLALAVCLWLYSPFQLKKDILRDLPANHTGGIGLESEALEHYRPPLAGQFLYVMNFPAYCLTIEAVHSYYVRTIPSFDFSFGNPLNRIGGYFFGVREVVLFGGIFILWFWVGSKIDERRKRPAQVPSRYLGLKLIEAAILIALTVLTLYRSLTWLSVVNCPPPKRTIAEFGLVWPAIFLIYLFLSIRQGSRSVTSAP